MSLFLKPHRGPLNGDPAEFARRICSAFGIDQGVPIAVPPDIRTLTLSLRF